MSYSDPTFVTFHYVKGDPPFIYRVDGPITHDMFCEIEDDASSEESIPYLFNKGDGSYRLEATYISAQTNECGQIELSAYYDLSLVSFEPYSECRDFVI